MRKVNIVQVYWLCQVTLGDVEVGYVRKVISFRFIGYVRTR